MKQALPNRLYEILLIGLVVGIVFLLFRNVFVVQDLRTEVRVIQSNRFTSQDFVHFVTNAPGMADSLRQALDIPPPEVRRAIETIDSLRARLDSLEARHEQ